jgi:hypothetical protein
VRTSGRTSPYRLRLRSSRAGPDGRRDARGVAGRLAEDEPFDGVALALGALGAAGLAPAAEGRAPPEPRAVVVPREPDGRDAGRRDEGGEGRRDGTSRFCRA